MRRSMTFRPSVNLQLEDRVVLSGFGGHLAPQIANLVNLGASALGRGGDLGGGFEFRGTEGGRQNGPPGGDCAGVGSTTSSSSALGDYSTLTRQAFQTLNASLLSAVATLRTTATTTAGPTSAGLDAFNTAVDNAIARFNTTISSDTALAGLPNTGAGLVTTIEGITATLATELKSAGSGLAGSTNASVRALQREVNSYIRSASGQVLTAIRNDQPTGTITGTTLRTYNQTIRPALRTFNTAINSAARTSVSGGTTLDATAVHSAVTALQTSLTSAISALGISSTYDPTTTVTTALTNLEAALTSLTAPTAGSRSSARLFLRSVRSTIDPYVSQIDVAVNTAVQDYNNSLL